MKAVVALIADPVNFSPPTKGRPCGEIPVVLIDDDEMFRTALSELLRDDGHTVQAYRSVAELPPVAKLSACDALITDYQLRGNENGLTLAHRFNAAHPGARITLMTAYASHHLEEAVAGMRDVWLLHRPV